MIVAKLSLNSDYFDAYDDTTPLALALTERQQAVLLALSHITLDRRTWEPITDNEWDGLEAWLAVLYETIA